VGAARVLSPPRPLAITELEERGSSTMTNENSIPRKDIRHEPAITAGLRMFDACGWPGVPVERAGLTDGGGGRRDYGPKGCVGFAVLPAIVAGLLFVLRGGRR
jgi:hypothetical protein